MPFFQRYMHWHWVLLHLSQWNCGVHYKALGLGSNVARGDYWWGFVLWSPSANLHLLLRAVSSALDTDDMTCFITLLWVLKWCQFWSHCHSCCSGRSVVLLDGCHCVQIDTLHLCKCRVSLCMLGIGMCGQLLTRAINSLTQGVDDMLSQQQCLRCCRPVMER